MKESDLRVEQDPSRRRGEHGFSLVELMVVITIIGILAGIAVPKFQTFRARATQTEAKSGLNAIFLSLQAYEANYGEYPVQAAATAMANRIDAIGFSSGGNRQRYQYSYISNVLGWAAYARSTNALVEGRWDYFRINTNKWLCQPFDAITGLGANPTPAVTTQGAGTDCPQAFNANAANQLPALTNADCGLGTELTCLNGGPRP